MYAASGAGAGQQPGGNAGDAGAPTGGAPGSGDATDVEFEEVKK